MVARLVAGALATVIAGVGVGFTVNSRASPKAAAIVGLTGSRERAARETIMVHVAGAVYRPAVYRLDSTARVNDAIAAAGGSMAEADLDAINLASTLMDGDKIVVPFRGGGPDGGEGGGAAAADDRIDLNKADAAELDKLPGVGPSTAARIIEYRESAGGFRRVEDLMNVPGIGERRFEQLKDLVRV